MSRGSTVFYITDKSLIPNIDNNIVQELDLAVVRSSDTTTANFSNSMQAFQVRRNDKQVLDWHPLDLNNGNDQLIFTDNIIIPNVTKSRKAHMEEVRNYINLMVSTYASRYGAAFHHVQNFTDGLMYWAGSSSTFTLDFVNKKTLTLFFGSNSVVNDIDHSDKFSIIFKDSSAAQVQTKIADFMGWSIHIYTQMILDKDLSVAGNTTISKTAFINTINLTGNSLVHNARPIFTISADDKSLQIGSDITLGSTIVFDKINVCANSFMWNGSNVVVHSDYGHTKDGTKINSDMVDGFHADSFYGKITTKTNADLQDKTYVEMTEPVTSLDLKDVDNNVKDSIKLLRLTCNPKEISLMGSSNTNEATIGTSLVAARADHSHAFATFNITFEPSNGDPISQKTILAGSYLQTPRVPMMTGYDFKGWSIGDTGEIYDFTSIVKSDLNLVGTWVLKTFIVSFVPNSIPYITILDQKITYGHYVSISDPVTRVGFDLIGWFVNPSMTNPFILGNGGTPVTNDLTLYADWNQIKFTITFDSNGGTAEMPQIVNHGSTVKVPLPPTRETVGSVIYNFGGWVNYAGIAIDKSLPITEDAVWTASWIQDTLMYTVRYVTPRGLVNLSDKIVALTPATTPGDLAATGFIFGGWYTDSSYINPYDFSTPITKDTSIYAKWTARDYTSSATLDGHITFTGERQTGFTINAGELVSGFYGKLNTPEVESAKLIIQDRKASEHSFPVIIVGNEWSVKLDDTITAYYQISDAPTMKTINLVVSIKDGKQDQSFSQVFLVIQGPRLFLNKLFVASPPSATTQTVTRITQLPQKTQTWTAPFNGSGECTITIVGGGGTGSVEANYDNGVLCRGGAGGVIKGIFKYVPGKTYKIIVGTGAASYSKDSGIDERHYTPYFPSTGLSAGEAWPSNIQATTSKFIDDNSVTIASATGGGTIAITDRGAMKNLPSGSGASFVDSSIFLVDTSVPIAGGIVSSLGWDKPQLPAYQILSALTAGSSGYGDPTSAGNGCLIKMFPGADGAIYIEW